ncbi:hypothetical protein BBJ28_00002201 [Nothophytophthora sp. Chile5]|nr:hypothetical protein BBJ28_00002201 [Nothophytophthora sp. Chile5]
MALLATVSNGFTLTITNACSSDIELYTRLASVYTDASETLAVGASVDKTIEKGYEGNFRNGSDDAATLVEFATKGDLDLAWFDIGIIPPRLDAGYEYCTSLAECQQHSDSGIGYNTPVQVTPQSNTDGDNCRQLTCLADGCADAYNYPTDDSKTHSCPMATNFVMTFCPSGDSSTTTVTTSGSASASQETTAPVTEVPATESPATEAPATEAPVTEAPATETPAASEDGQGTVHSDTAAAEATDAAVTPAPTDATVTPAPTSTDGQTAEATPAATPAATKSKYCVRTQQDKMALNAASKRLGRLLPSSSVLFVCDVQEVFRGKIYQLPTAIHGTNTMVAAAVVSAAKLLDLPVVVTTQYASRLGSTVTEITKNLEDAKDVAVFDKMKFSMLTPEVDEYLASKLSSRKSVILCGIETHVCVLQTCLDLLDKGFDVHVVADAVSSSSSFNRSIALDRMRQSGAFITSVETAIFQLANDASNPEFKGVSKLIKEHLKAENGFDSARL